MTIAHSLFSRLLLSSLFIFLGLGPASSRLTTQSGSADIMSISGERGDYDREIEVSRGKGLIEISLFESDLIPCELSIEGKRVGANADYESDTAGRCQGSSKRSSNVDARYGYYINAIRVCSGGNAMPVLKGFEIDSFPIQANGDIGAQAPRDRAYMSGCNRWHNWSRCNAHAVMVGLKVHFEGPPKDKPRNDAIVGIQALCLDLEMH